MKVRFLEGVAGNGVAFYPGDVANVPDDLAQRYIAQGTCEAVASEGGGMRAEGGGPKRSRKREKAVSGQREMAVTG